MSARTIGSITLLGLIGLLAGCAGQQTPPVSAASDPAQPTEAATADAEVTATIEGRVSFPAGFRPDLDVYAINVDDPDRWYTLTVSGTETVGHDPQGKYSLPVPAGTYYVLAYPNDAEVTGPGLYSRMVPCGLMASCTDHTLLPVTVRPTETATGIDPGDWYYAEGHEYPDRPE